MEKVKSSKKYLIVGHVSEIVGPGHHLRDYFLALKDSLTKVIFFPMPGTKIDYISIEKYKGKKKLSVKKIEKKKLSNLKLIKDTLLTLREIYKFSGRIDYYIGLNNFDTLPAIFFKGWKIEKVVYYGSDYADRRFENIALNLIYRLVELVVLRFSDLVVSNTKRSMQRRIELGLDKEKAIVIPNGVDLSRIPKMKKRVKYQFVYLGYLSETHGIIDLLKTFNQLKENYNDTKLAIVGTGPAKDKVRMFIKKYQLERNVDVVGRLEHYQALKFLKQKCAVGIASYNTTEGWTKYASPLKVKEYLACGLAVIISDVPEIANDIQNKNLGFVYNNKKDLYLSMEKFCLDTRLAFKISRNSTSYIKDFDWLKMYRKYLYSFIK